MNKRSRPKIDKQVPNCNASAVAKPESKNEPSHREPAVLREQGGMRPRRPRRSFATIDDEWSRLERQLGRLKEALLTDREIPEAVEPARLTRERLLYNLREPLKFDLSDELKFALYYHKHNPKDQIDREVKIDNRPLLEFSLRYATRLMITEIELIAAADRHRAIVESYREMQELSAVTPEGANLREIKHATPKARLKKANAAPTRRLNGSVVPKLPQKIDSATARRSNGHTPT